MSKQLSKQPNWTVIYYTAPNVSPEVTWWCGVAYEFFDLEADAEASYFQHVKSGNGYCKRPYYPPRDYMFLHIMHDEACKAGREAEDRVKNLTGVNNEKGV